MNEIEKITAFAEECCEARGFRLTRKRRLVLAALLKSKKALSAYELVSFCDTEFGEVIPAMSVYRILAFLEERHLAHKLNSANKHVACTNISTEHEHSATQFLICQKCKIVEEIEVDALAIAQLQDNIEHVGFHLLNQQLEMNCICDKCATELS